MTKYGKGENSMCSRRAFLIGLFLGLTHMGLVRESSAAMTRKSHKKFMKQGWLLQEGDV